MVRAFTFAAPQLGMLAPPPLLWLSNLPVSSASHTGIKSEFHCNATRVLRANDRFLMKAMTPNPSKVPSMVVAVDEKSTLGADDESLSDSSSYKDSDSMSQPRSTSSTLKRDNSICSVKLALPPGRPLRAKPRLVNPSFLKTRSARRTKASVPLKLAVSKASLLRRSSLSQDEKLFVEAAATLVQTMHE